MKKRIFPLALCLVALCGCAHEYVMKLNNGTQLTSPHKPKLEGSNYHFKDAQGRDNYIPQSRVVEIAPASMVAEEDKFTPTSPKPRHWWQFWK